MHYHGTYAMAIAAGLSSEVAKIIATSSALCDDAVARTPIEFPDGACFVAEPTAHHALDQDNINKEHQREIWIPFHFLPGNEGQTYEERLICRMDSAISQEMLRHHIGERDESYYLYLIGIAAHVYADTFSHFGFSGISSEYNSVDTQSIEFHELNETMTNYIRGKAETFFQKYLSPNVENLEAAAAQAFSGSLGHAGVATHPDRPYLSWSFQHMHSGALAEKRDNRVNFLIACRSLHRFFHDVGTRIAPTSQNLGIAFDGIVAAVNDVLGLQGTMEERIQAWKTAAMEGRIAAGTYEIPDYDPERWGADITLLRTLDDSRQAPAKPIFKFHQAAAAHKHYVLNRLLPSHGLIAI